MKTETAVAVDFKVIAQAVTAQFSSWLDMQHALLQTNIDKDELWQVYLDSFPEGSNPIFRYRTEHDCNCCRQFIRAIGGIVAVKDGDITTLWDVPVPAPYSAVCSAMSAFVRRHDIENVYMHTDARVGTEVSREALPDGSVRRWNHFYLSIPQAYTRTVSDIGGVLGDTRSTYDLMLRGLREITPAAIDTVLELISQNGLYRGEEQKFALTEFQKLKTRFDLLDAEQQTLFCWERVSGVRAPIARIRNTNIGTLLLDLSEGRDVDAAVASFEAKAAPENYKRPTAVVTKAMIEKAKATVEDTGYSTALERRYAVMEDITINNVLFADRSTRRHMSGGSVFDELSAGVPVNAQTYKNVDEVPINRFINEVLPRASNVSMLFESRLTNRLVSLIAPVHPEAKRLFKWDNNFSWDYVGGFTDSIKERVKRAGGSVTGDFRASLSWFNSDDLDLHMIEPGGGRIFYGQRNGHASGGNLDVDMNAREPYSREAVENIAYPDRRRMREGVYTLLVHQFYTRETQDVGFDCEIEFAGKTYNFHYDKRVSGQVQVAQFKYSHTHGVELIHSLPLASPARAGKQVWGLPVDSFVPVSVVMLSPNYWDGKGILNKHYFFMLQGCLNEGQARGFFNEFLIADLDKHRKVFEQVGAKMLTDTADRQLSGVGFSSTQRDSVLCKVEGSFNRMVKIVL